ncbi:MAG: hypothetical protein QG654_466 [Patescibacteria group bacterium]|nr:hypothetical protein [Patescibacteria group bacterium]
MANILKVILWLAVIGIIIYLAFGKNKKEVVAPTPEMTGGAGGDRVESGPNLDSRTELSSEISIQGE